MEHYSVMMDESLEMLNIKSGGVYVDCTAGGGGHSEAIVRAMDAEGLLISMDKDLDAVQRVTERLAHYGEASRVVHSDFSEIKNIVDALGVAGKVSGVLADLGTSLFQLKDGSRGFSFLLDGPLDMRMNVKCRLTAAEILNSYSKDDLYRIFRDFGEERHASRISREVIEWRKHQKFTTTRDFAELIEKLAGSNRGQKKKIHPATRCFQALRIEVNNELESLKEFLSQALDVLCPGGRLVVISFHSLEDRIVKNFFRDQARDCVCSEKSLRCECGGSNAKVKILTRKALKPSDLEIKENPPSRSSRLRACEKLRGASDV